MHPLPWPRGVRTYLMTDEMVGAAEFEDLTVEVNVSSVDHDPRPTHAGSQPLPSQQRKSFPGRQVSDHLPNGTTVGT
jgi:hypothetical protein